MTDPTLTPPRVRYPAIPLFPFRQAVTLARVAWTPSRTSSPARDAAELEEAAKGVSTFSPSLQTKDDGWE